MLLFTASDFSDGHISDGKNYSNLRHCCQFLSANNGTENIKIHFTNKCTLY